MLLCRLNENYGPLLADLNYSYTVGDTGHIETLLRPIQWTEKLRNQLQQSLLDSEVIQICVQDFVSIM